MKVIRGIYNFRSDHRGCVATIGNFDGVHLGHQTVISQLSDKGKELGLPVVVITFEPHPKDYFVPTFAPPRISRLRDKMINLAVQGVDYVLLLNFSHKLAYMQAGDFVDQVLVKGLGIKYLVVGDDFHFGAERKGDFGFLQMLGERKGFKVVQMPTHQLDGSRVSSTRVRKALLEKNMDCAARLLGRYYSISGRVRHGDKLGRQLDFPTANIGLPKMPFPVAGVYAVQVNGICEKSIPGVANVGIRPTVDGKKALLEVHLLDFQGDIYGKYIGVDFLEYIRAEKKFSSVGDLKSQIAKDVEQSRKFFNNRQEQIG
ncbi:MAG: bifunctional riboflavin kinase/FAD synthetase [Gammaproteobacteria bacterium]|nr:MAG: bifunctional riboflavin kinase/FAD synthetase [Gammaproteobacteria bacterium]